MLEGLGWFWGGGEGRERGRLRVGVAHLEGKVNGEPRHHAAALGIHGQRVGAQLGAGVEHGFEVAG